MWIGRIRITCRHSIEKKIKNKEFNNFIVLEIYRPMPTEDRPAAYLISKEEKNKDAISSFLQKSQKSDCVQYDFATDCTRRMECALKNNQSINQSNINQSSSTWRAAPTAWPDNRVALCIDATCRIRIMCIKENERNEPKPLSNESMATRGPFFPN